MKTYNIEQRKRVLVNTDPQRRCYNGCHFSSELLWTEWEQLELDVSEEYAESRLKFWRELNQFAVDQRGDSATKEFRSVEVNS